MTHEMKVSIPHRIFLNLDLFYEDGEEERIVSIPHRIFLNILYLS